MMGRKRFGIEKNEKNEKNELRRVCKREFKREKRAHADPFSVPRCIGRETGTRTGRAEEDGRKGRKGKGDGIAFDSSSDG